MEKEKSCGAVIVKEDAERLYALVIRQNQGHWCFPKGHVEKNERKRKPHPVKSKKKQVFM